MITPPTDCFYVIQVQGEAAEFVTAVLSVGAIADIKEAVLISEDFDNDIQACNGLDETMASVKVCMVDQDLTERTTHNPLYIPSTHDELDSVLDGDVKSEHFRFIGMDGNPFIMKTVSIMAGEDGLMLGKVSCKPFDLPPYSEIVANQIGMKLN